MKTTSTVLYVLALAILPSLGTIGICHQLNAQTTIVSESFETDGLDTRYTSSKVCDGGNNHIFTRKQAPPAGNYPVVSPDGNFFWAVRDPTESPCSGNSTARITLSPVDVRGYENLTFKGLFAEGAFPGKRWETNAAVFVDYSLNNGKTWTKILQFANLNTAEGVPRLDTDLDGRGDGQLLTDTFAEFTASIPEKGTELLLRVTSSKLNDSGDNIAFDFLRVEGDFIGCEGNSDAPTALCSNRTVDLDENGQATVDLNNLNGGSFDDCTALQDLILASSITAFTCADIGSNEIVLTVTDEDGNTSTCTANWQVRDQINPIAICQDATIELTAGGTAELLTNQIDNGSSDACLSSITLSQTDFGCNEIGDNSVTLTVEDASGRKATCTATVTVEDNMAPQAICQSTTVELDADGMASITTADIDDNSNDNCGIAEFSFDLNTLETELDFNCNDLGENPVVLQVTDLNGNSATCTATIVVEGNLGPEALCQSTTVQLDAEGMASITTDDIDNSSTAACGIAGLSLNQTDFDCSDVGTNMVTLTVTDNNENTTTCTTTVTVEDNTAPQAICQSTTIQLDAAGIGSITTADIDNGSNDICGISGLSLDQTDFGCSDVGENMITLTVTDNNGNTATCTTTVTVEDKTAPQAICQPTTVQLDAAGMGSITTADVDNSSNDACGISGLSLDQTDFGCSDVGENMITLTVTDNNGNTATCMTTVTVEDNIAPQAICQSTTVQLDAAGMGSISTADIDNGSNDICGISGLNLNQTDFDCSDIGANIVTLTVTDNNGNTAICMAAVTIEDNTAPQAICQSTTVQLDAAGMGSISTADIDNGSNDICGIAGLSLNQTDFDCSDIGANIVTLTVTDNNGNTATCMAAVTIEDNTAPQAICQSTTVQLDAAGMGSITIADINNNSSDACGIASLSLDQMDFDCSQVGDNTVSLTAVDANDNSASCSATVTVIDNSPPIIDCFNQTIVFNGEEAIDLDPLDLVSSTDNCSIASTVLSPNYVSCEQLGEEIPVAITVTDATGNPSNCTVLVKVEGLPCGFSQDPDGINCVEGSSASYDPLSEAFTLSSTNCYYGSPFNTDEAAFVGTELCGDSEIIVEISSTTGLAWAGLQFRETMAANSKKFSLASNGSNFARREVRSQTGGAAFPQQIPAFGKRWLRLERQGNQFRGYLSNNGLFWQLVMVANIQMSDCIRAGMFVTNLTPNGTSTAVFHNLSIMSAETDALLDFTGTNLNLKKGNPATMEIFPNPTEGKVTVDLSSYQDQNLSLELINQFGQVLQSWTYQGIDGYFDELDLTSHPTGLYFIRLQDKNGTEQIERIILQRH